MVQAYRLFLTRDGNRQHKKVFYPLKVNFIHLKHHNLSKRVFSKKEFVRSGQSNCKKSISNSFDSRVEADCLK